MERIKPFFVRCFEKLNILFQKKGAKIICYIIAFIAINLYFGNSLYKVRTITPDELKTQVITVDRIRYTKSERMGTRFWIVADKKEFDIHTDHLRRPKLTVDSFQEMVTKGDQLTISYIRLSPLSKRLVIVEAYNDNGVYLTLEKYNADSAEPRIMAIIIYFLATCLYSFIMIASEGWMMQWVRQRNRARDAN